jgi:glycosyltransferase involved in cell wall biosynthesis
MIPKHNKILFILHLPPPIHGAAMVGQYIQQSKFINNAFDCDYINLSTSKKLTEIGRGIFNKFFTFAKLYFQVISLVRKNSYDLCYLTINSKGPGFYKEIIIVFLLKIFNKNVVYHYHNKGITQEQNKWLLNRLYYYQFRNSRVILLSKLLYPDITKFLTKEKVFYCPNGIPVINELNFELLSLNRKAKSVVEILFLSNMMNEKGVYTLLEACKILYNKGVIFITWFVGPWVDIKENEFNNFISNNNLKENVFYCGTKYDNEKSVHFASADIFSLPTMNDCFPLVVLEAMQYGLPIISTYEGAIPEIVEDSINGYIVPRKNPVILAEKIEYLINNPQLRIEMGRRGRKKFEDLFTFEKFENNFINTLKEVIGDFNSGQMSL